MQEASIEFYWSHRESIWHQLGDSTSCRIHVLRLTILADIGHCLTGSNSPRIINDIIILQLICKLSSSVYVQEWTSMHVHAMKGSQNAYMYVHNLYRDSAPIQPQAYRIDYYNYADLDLHEIWIPAWVCAIFQSIMIAWDSFGNCISHTSHKMSCKPEYHWWDKILSPTCCHQVYTDKSSSIASYLSCHAKIDCSCTLIHNIMQWDVTTRSLRWFDEVMHAHLLWLLPHVCDSEFAIVL